MLASIEYLAQRAFVALSVTDDDDGKEEGAARVGRDLLRIFHRGLGDEMRAALSSPPGPAGVVGIGCVGQLENDAPDKQPSWVRGNA